MERAVLWREDMHIGLKPVIDMHKGLKLVIDMHKVLKPVIDMHKGLKPVIDIALFIAICAQSVHGL